MSAGLTYTPGMYADVGRAARAVHDRRRARRLLRPAPPLVRQGRAGGVRGDDRPDDAGRLPAAPVARHHELRPEQGPGRRAARPCSTRRSTPAPTSPSTPTRTCPARTTLSAVLPSWSSAGGQEATLAPAARPGGARADPGGPGGQRLRRLPRRGRRVGHHRDQRGRPPGARRRRRADRRRSSPTAAGAAPFDVFVDLLVRDDLGTGILQHVGHEENVQAIMRHPRHTGGSDGLLVGAKPHPRAWGTFPRYLGHYCRELGLFSLEECVGHLTGRAAARLRLTRPRPGPRRATPPTWCCSTPTRWPPPPPTTNPRQPAAGIPFVLVNGGLAIDDGRRTDDHGRPGPAPAPRMGVSSDRLNPLDGPARRPGAHRRARRAHPGRRWSCAARWPTAGSGPSS